MKKVFYLLIISFIHISCSSKKTTNSNKEKENNMNFSTFELIVERGAFHYDSFVLKDTILTFFPEKENISNTTNIELKKYYEKSEQKISRKQLKKFIEKLQKSNIWELNNNYTCNSTCTSALKVILKIEDKEKTIQCQDFKRDCPEIIQYIEDKLIDLHHKKLKRIFLPG